MPEDLDNRRRRAYWRAHHRGTKELDLMIGGYADRYLADMSLDQLTQFERLLDEHEPVLQTWLLAPERPTDVAEPIASMVIAIRDFHGLSVRENDQKT